MADRNQIQFRSVETEDAALLKEWRNDERTRLASRRQASVTVPAEQWLKTFANERPGRLMYLVLKDGLPVGTIHTDVHDDGYTEISYTVAPECRGQGLGVLMVESFVRAYLTGAKIKACIIAGNIASEKIAKAIGLEPAHRTFLDGRVHVEWLS